MAGKARGEEALVVEFASAVPALSPGAARAVLDMLLEAREKQAEKAGEAEDDGCQADGHMPAVPCEVPGPSSYFAGALLEPDTTPMALNWENAS